MSATVKRFPVPDEAHPHRHDTMVPVYACESCAHEGDFAFCPMCGLRRLCPAISVFTCPHRTDPFCGQRHTCPLTEDL